MSEPVSAFAAYNSMDSKLNNKSGRKSAGARKAKQGKVSYRNTETKRGSQPKAKLKKNIPRSSSTSGSQKNGKVNSIANTKKNVNSKAGQNEIGIKKTKNQKDNIGSNSLNDINENDLENLVQELFTDGKPLSKAQLKKRNELEKYLESKLEENGAAGKNNYNSNTSSFDEYTLGSSDSETGSLSYSKSESEGESDSISYSESEYSDEDTISDMEEKLQAKKRGQPTAVKKAAVKRRSVKNVQTKKAGDAQSNIKRSRMSDVTNAKSKNKGPAIETVKNRNSVNSSVPIQSEKEVKSLKLQQPSQPSNIVNMNSVTEGERILNWLIKPITIKDFFTQYWEQNAYLIKRSQPNFFSHLISFEAIDQMLLNDHIEFTKNIDVTSYTNGVRKTHNPVGRALPAMIWDFYSQGCSIRLLNPQTFMDSIFKFNTTLQEYFHCMVGANVYITPPNSQGFAPHYDDIEAFVLQIEGRKRWKLYKPRSVHEALPRTSSINFTQDEIGKPILDEVLEPGDLLYFPRGTIHQACTEPNYHSLHITLSVYQKQSFADLFEQMFPQILKRAIASDIRMRRGLPLNMWMHTGIAHKNTNTEERSIFITRMTEYMKNCLASVSLEEVVDAAVDQLGKKFQQEALPPAILEGERNHTMYGTRNGTDEFGECVCNYALSPRTNIRLLRANILHLVQEDGTFHVYFYSDNSKEYCEYEPNFIEIDVMEATSIEFLINSYPAYVGVSQIPMKNDKRRIEFATGLWERGLLMTEKSFD